MANYPTFNPNAYREFNEKDRRNRAIQDMYEPGSTFKIVTATAALRRSCSRRTHQSTSVRGYIRFGARIIDEDKHHNYGLQTFKGVIVQSSNVGAIKSGSGSAADRMGDYVRRFGFGRPTSPDFPGENSGHRLAGAH